MVILCAHLLWSKEPKRPLRNDEAPPAPGQDSKRALECLKRALKIANGCTAPAQHNFLLTQILNRYAYFCSQGMDSVSAQNVTDLAAIIRGNLSEERESGGDTSSYESFFISTCQYLKGKEQFAAME
jgi:vacuolar protein sorting-associated protein 35